MGKRIEDEIMMTHKRYQEMKDTYYKYLNGHTSFSELSIQYNRFCKLENEEEEPIPKERYGIDKPLC